jgi:divalent metal cation (Fe/Co/Zn/Cd) transporter
VNASLWLKVELFATVGAVVGIGVLATNGWLAKEYAALAIGFFTGSGLRSVAAASVSAPAKPADPTS